MIYIVVFTTIAIISQSDWLICRGREESRQCCSRQCVKLLVTLWKKNNISFDVDIVVKKQIECGLALSVLLSVDNDMRRFVYSCNI